MQYLPSCCSGWPRRQLDLRITAPVKPLHWLGRHGVLLTHDGLVAALKNPDVLIRRFAAQQLSEINDDKDAIPAIRDAAARDPKFANRLYMAYDLARLGDASGADSLKAACSDVSVGIYDRLQAADEMLYLHSDVCFPDVLSILRSSTDAGAVVQALEFCSNAKHQLEDEGNQNTPPDKQRDRLVLELVAKRVSDPDGSVRFIAGDALARLGDSSQAYILEDAISRETNEGMRRSLEEDLEILLKKPPAN